jgi:hypothetical protein
LPRLPEGEVMSESRRDKEGREGEVGELLIRIEQRESKREARLGS